MSGHPGGQAGSTALMRRATDVSIAKETPAMIAGRHSGGITKMDAV
jgi:hypothetical protein